MDDEKKLAELSVRAKALGYKIVKDPAYKYILVRDGSPPSPHNHANWNLADLQEMLDGIEWGRRHGTAEP